MRRSMISKICPECGAEFNAHYKSKYCSKSCKYHGYYRARARPIPPRYSIQELKELENKSNMNLISFYKNELQQIDNDPTMASKILKQTEYSRLIKNGIIIKKTYGYHKGVKAVLVYLTPETLKILAEIEEQQ
jgi:hypothetical protein